MRKLPKFYEKVFPSNCIFLRASAFFLHFMKMAEPTARLQSRLRSEDVLYIFDGVFS